MSRRKPYLVIVVTILVILAAGLVAYNHSKASEPVQSKNTATTSTPRKSEPQQQSTQPPVGFDKARYSTTDPTSPWVVVNKQHPLNPISYAPGDLTSVGNGQQMRAEAAAALKQLFADASAAGYTLTADSGYRSYGYQVNVYGGYVKQWGQTYTDTVSARPGYSEHQTGWAVDIGTGSCHVDSCFGNTPGGQWTQTNAYKYGFLLRYPAGLTDTTGYSAEAWHFRYIGPLLSNQMHTENVLALEQFFGVSGGTIYK